MNEEQAQVAPGATISEPTNTSSNPPQEQAPTEETHVEDQQQVENPEVRDASEEVSEDQSETNDTDEAVDYLNFEQLQELHNQTTYQPEEVEIDFVDEYGNFDANKFQNFMAENNRRIFEKSQQAMQASTKAEQIEASTWNHVYKTYPEIEKGSTFEVALRGARVQDLISGGDGDINRLAKEMVAPIRQAKISAVESTNRQITEQKKLDSYKPEEATPAPAEAPSLMVQLNSAIANGDSEKASRIRHAIRKERIYGKSNNAS